MVEISGIGGEGDGDGDAEGEGGGGRSSDQSMAVVWTTGGHLLVVVFVLHMVEQITDDVSTTKGLEVEVSQCSKSGAEAEVSLSLALDLFGNWQVRASHGRLFDSSNWLNDLPDLHYLYTLQLRLLTRNINVPATPSLSGTSCSSTSATSPQILIERLRTQENLTTTPRTCTGHHG